MGMFDFLSGMQGDPGAYSQFQPTQDYSQILGGGQAQSQATQGLDFGKIGDWATQMAQKTQWAKNPSSANFQGVLAGGNATPQTPPSYAQALQSLQGIDQKTQQQPWALPQQAGGMGGRGGQMQAPNNQAPGYIGRGTHLGLLGMTR